ncbi:unnamed protein product [Sphagnum balticum]
MVSPILFLLKGQHPKPLVVVLWEEPKPLAMRDQYAFDAAGDLFGSPVTVELPPPECVSDSVRKVIGMGIPTSSPKENKGHYLNLEDFQEIYEDCMLIHNGEMVATILHAFVPSIEASEHVQTLGDLFWYGGTMLRTCSPESQMVLFGHRFCRDDLTVDRSRTKIVLRLKAGMNESSF